MSPRRSVTAPALARRAWMQRRFGRVFVALQVLALALAMQMSGALHRIADLVFHDDCDAECGHESSGGDDDSECPPGCPTCHACAHAQAVYVPRAAALPAPPIALVTDAPTYEAHAPLSPLLDSVFRPPRA